MRSCVEDGCERSFYARGWCKMHYLRAWSRGEVNARARSLVAPGATLDERLRHHGWDVTSSGCWEWRGARGVLGYGQLAVGGSRPETASRVAYEAWVGPIGPGMAVCHRCDNPPCINPEHLFLGERAVNNSDMRAKNRHAHGETSPSAKLTDAQVTEIRERYAAGAVLQRELAAEFGVCCPTISMIINRTRRKSETYGDLR